MGRDILAGLEQLDAEHDLGIRFVQTRSPSVLAGPAFVDFLAGENTRPATKNDALLAQLDARSAPDGAVAMLKYCYVDIGARSDVRHMFDEYRRMIATLRVRHPDVTVVHVTIPVTSVESALKARMKEIAGRPTMRAANLRRQEYNALLRAAFAGREPLYDLAALEASGVITPPDRLTRTGREIEALDPAFTDDGGHLNLLGRRMAAAALLDVLGGLALQEDHA